MRKKKAKTPSLGDKLYQQLSGPPRRPIDADQIGLIVDAITAALSVASPAMPTAPREAMTFGLLHEIMYLADLRFADAKARTFGMPYMFRQGGPLDHD